MDSDDIRVTAAICTPGEVSGLIGMPKSTLYTWIRATRSKRGQMVHSAPALRRGWPTIPLVGLAEATSLRALRQASLSMADAVDIATFFRLHFGDEYALANPSIVSDGIDAYIDHLGVMSRVGDNQIPIKGVVERFLHPLIAAPDGYAEAFSVEQFNHEVVIDPRFNGGAMSFLRNRVPVAAVAGSLSAGEEPDSVCLEFGLTGQEVTLVERNLEWFADVA